MEKTYIEQRIEELEKKMTEIEKAQQQPQVTLEKVIKHYIDLYNYAANNIGRLDETDIECLKLMVEINKNLMNLIKEGQ
ncbi:hypothetical protein Q3V94_00505 [Caloramator sp. CAR-1]|uniref:hypothetical protein n=1 Tax=Caloramator sp. CAR-1 TaxID=3062777 RepID=UPI0026E25A85|nr:hypothetical protein [Caloramator sp. CAR-1]MDO6353564.1 hypothetical protein [Caloramator sp. CAR-1]